LLLGSLNNRLLSKAAVPAKRHHRVARLKAFDTLADCRNNAGNLAAR
jgi:hypothetical protein